MFARTHVSLLLFLITIPTWTREKKTLSERENLYGLTFAVAFIADQVLSGNLRAPTLLSLEDNLAPDRLYTNTKVSDLKIWPWSKPAPLGKVRPNFTSNYLMVSELRITATNTNSLRRAARLSGDSCCFHQGNMQHYHFCLVSAKSSC